ncbi:hypothetical protein EA187_15890 [Lujinxingia sediminis]|uniref:Uncharacterized protein n=1 Tax=Lujinxingia sediminis TaxID=2480984 RepID=A0ABY0CQB5_9DELT|nr:hypothetical protein [Lujinxingia sediminis]RVU42668.1 hypothetical protein EA187_15890 [Lujinxingia sediminis]
MVRARVVGFALIALFMSTACQSGPSAVGGTGGGPIEGSTSQVIDEEFGPLSQEQIEGFHREILSQYTQLDLQYERYDAALIQAQQDALVAMPAELAEEHERIARRHLGIARHHEDRLLLELGDDQARTNDGELAEINRALGSWHQNRSTAAQLPTEEEIDQMWLLREELMSARERMLEIHLPDESLDDTLDDVPPKAPGEPADDPWRGEPAPPEQY